MSTLVNIVVAVVANLLTIVGVPQEAKETSRAEIMECQYTYQQYVDSHYIIKNEQLSQKIN